MFELSNENHLNQWRRAETFVPSITKRFHTMKAVCGTVKQEFGAKNIGLRVYLSVSALFEFSPKIDRADVLSPSVASPGRRLQRLGEMLVSALVLVWTQSRLRRLRPLLAVRELGPETLRVTLPTPRGPIIRTSPCRTARFSPSIVPRSLGLGITICFQECVQANPGNSTASCKCLRVSTRLPGAISISRVVGATRVGSAALHTPQTMKRKSMRRLCRFVSKSIRSCSKTGSRCPSRSVTRLVK